MDEGRRVREANRAFYDLAVDVYEEVDGRRQAVFPAWLDNVLAELKGRSQGSALLDLGAGAGWIVRGAHKYFPQVVAVDISPLILRKVPAGLALRVAGEGESLPFRDSSFDVVTCFAVLHHIYDWQPVLTEAFRVLRPGGLFYADHDLDRAFMDRFRWPMKLYRALFDPARRYRKAEPRLTQNLYAMTEVHSDGVDARGILDGLAQAGFEGIQPSWHWLGLTPATDRVFGRHGHGGLPRGSAPLFSVMARKPEGAEAA